MGEYLQAQGETDCVRTELGAFAASEKRCQRVGEENPCVAIVDTGTGFDREGVQIDPPQLFQPAIGAIGRSSRIYFGSQYRSYINSQVRTDPIECQCRHGFQICSSECTFGSAGHVHYGSHSVDILQRFGVGDAVNVGIPTEGISKHQILVQTVDVSEELNRTTVRMTPTYVGMRVIDLQLTPFERAETVGTPNGHFLIPVRPIDQSIPKALFDAATIAIDTSEYLFVSDRISGRHGLLYNYLEIVLTILDHNGFLPGTNHRIANGRRKAVGVRGKHGGQQYGGGQKETFHCFFVFRNQNRSRWRTCVYQVLFHCGTGA